MVFYGTTSNQYITAVIEWDFTQDIDANTSTVTATLYYRRTNSGYTTSGTGDFTITIDGQSTTAKSKQMAIGTAWVKAVSKTQKVYHNSDGRKTITISASGGMSGTTLTSTSCSGTFDLTTIPRASAITSVYGGTLGSYCHVAWTPLSISFRYKLKFTLGDWSDTTEAIHPNVNFKYEYDYALPLTVANQLPNAKTGTMTVTLYTYSDSAAKTQVGSASSKTFTVTIPNNSTTQPTVSMSLTPVHSLVSKFASVYVQGKSKARATLSATGEYDATVPSGKMWMTALNKTDGASPYETDVLVKAGTTEIIGYATDSRGFTGSTKQNITVIPYNQPKIIPASGEKSIICARCDENGNLSDSGTYLKIKAKRSYSKVESGTQLNYCAIRYRCKPATNALFTDSDWVTILAKNSASDEVTTTPIADVVSNTSISYIVEVGVVDDVGESSSLMIIIPTSSVTFHLKDGGNGAAFGKYAESEKCLEVSPDWSVKILGGLEVGGISAYVVEQGESGIWSYRKWSNGFAECWGCIQEAKTFNSSWGSLYVCSTTSAINYPFEFVERPTETATARTRLYDCWLVAKGTGDVINSATYSGKYFAVRPTQVEDEFTLYIDIIVKGRWK